MDRYKINQQLFDNFMVLYFFKEKKTGFFKIIYFFKAQRAKHSLLLLIISPPSPRSPRWRGGCVARAPLGDASACSVVLTLYIYYIGCIRSSVNAICKLWFCCSVDATCLSSWAIDPSSVALPELPNFHHSFDFTALSFSNVRIYWLLNLLHYRKMPICGIATVGQTKQEPQRCHLFLHFKAQII